MPKPVLVVVDDNEKELQFQWLDIERGSSSTFGSEPSPLRGRANV